MSLGKTSLIASLPLVTSLKAKDNYTCWKGSRLCMRAPLWRDTAVALLGTTQAQNTEVKLTHSKRHLAN